MTSLKQFIISLSFQNCIDWNRDVLRKELGLDEEDIIDLPILFKVEDDIRAAAYYPDMVDLACSLK